MYIAITRVAPERACTNCSSRNILVHSMHGGPLYGQYCSFDCQIAARKTDASRVAHRPSPVALPRSPAHIVQDSPDALETAPQQRT